VWRKSWKRKPDSPEALHALRHVQSCLIGARPRNPGPFQNDDPASPNYEPGNTPDPSTNLLNLRATLRRARYDVALFVNNALDSRPTILRFRYGLPGSTAGGPPSPVFATTFKLRTVGLSASWHF
jgi:hypothetical protein